MSLPFPHEAFLDDDFLGRDATWVPEGMTAGFSSDSDLAGFISDPDTGPGFLAESGTPIRITFSLGVEDVNLGGNITPQGAVAQAGIASADAVGIRNKDVLWVDGVLYRVLRVHPDETGWSTIFLGRKY